MGESLLRFLLQQVHYHIFMGKVEEKCKPSSAMAHVGEVALKKWGYPEGKYVGNGNVWEAWHGVE